MRKKVIDLKQELYDRTQKLWPQEQEKILRDQIVKASREANQLTLKNQKLIVTNSNMKDEVRQKSCMV